MNIWVGLTLPQRASEDVDTKSSSSPRPAELRTSGWRSRTAPPSRPPDDGVRHTSEAKLGHEEEGDDPKEPDLENSIGFKATPGSSSI